jgi:GT2 family glycosyltransferase
MYIDERFTSDSYENFSGVVGHGEGLPQLRQLSIYGPPGLPVKLLDGLFLAVRSSMLSKHELRFDPQFDFHFYDMDFCRQAEMRGLRMGTCPISVVHRSAGQLGTPAWSAGYARYLRKYGN